MDLETGKTEQSREARLQKRREKARARRIRETAEQRQVRLEQRRAADCRRRQTQRAGLVATKKRCYDRKYQQQKRAKETTPERLQRMEANRVLQVR